MADIFPGSAEQFSPFEDERNAPQDIFPGDAEERVPFDALVRTHHKTNPDQAAEDRRVAGAIGANKDLVSRNRDVTYATRDAREMEKTLAETPVAREFARDNYDIVKDDLENLAGFERALAKAEYIEQAPSALEYYTKGTFGDAVGTGKSLLKWGARVLPNWGELTGNIVGLAGGISESTFEALQSVLPEPLDAVVEPFKQSSAWYKTWGYGHAELIRKQILDSDILSLPEEKRGRLIDSPRLLLDPEYMTFQTGEALTSMIPAVAGGAVAKSVEVASLIGASMEASSFYKELLDDGVDQDTAGTAAVAYGWASAWLNKLGFERFTKSIPTNSLIKQGVHMAISGGTEALTEGAEEPVSAVIGAIAKGEDLNGVYDAFWEGMANAPDVMAGSFVLGSMGNQTIRKALIKEHARALDAVKSRERIDMLNALAAENKLVGRDPEAFADFVRRVTEENDSGDIFLQNGALEEVFGEDQEGMQVFLQETGLEQAYQEAAALGADLAIPLEVYVTQVAAHAIGPKLADDLKFSLDGMTAREAAEFDPDLEYAALVEKVRKLKSNAPLSPFSDNVREGVVSQIMAAAPNQKEDDIRAQVALFERMAGMVARVRGITPDEYLAMRGLRITNEEGFVNRDEVLHQFAGERAATADLGALARAKQMTEEGAAPEDIWRETGWVLAPDGKWRFEIDDSGAEIERTTDVNGLDRLIKHPDLFKAYPELAHLRTEITELIGAKGEFSQVGASADSRQIRLSEQLLPAGRKPLSSESLLRMAENLRRFLEENPDGNQYNSREATEAKIAQYEEAAKTAPTAGEKWNAEGLSTTLHEIQHAIQAIEDFAEGGSPSLISRLAHEIPDVKAYIDGLVAARMTAEGMDEHPAVGRPSLADYAKAKGYKRPTEKLKRMYAEEFRFGEYMNRSIEIRNEILREQYFNLHGETEARATQDRMNMTAEERRANFPGFMRRGDLIIKRGDEVDGRFVSEDDAVFYQTQSSRVPKAKAATEDALNEVLTVDFDVALADTKTLAKNMKTIMGYANMRPLTGKGSRTPAVQAEAFVQHAVHNLLAVYDAVPEEIRERSKLWYEGGRRVVEAWADRYGISEMQAAAAIAVLSPQKDWYQNVTQAERILDIYFTQQDTAWTPEMDEVATVIAGKNKQAMEDTRGKTLGEVAHDPSLAARWIRVYDETYNSRSYKVVAPEGGALGNALTKSGGERTSAWGSFDEIAKAVSVITDGRAENVSFQLGGQHKVRSFYNNLFAPEDSRFITIDTHAVAAALMQALSGNDIEVLHNFGGTGASSSSLTGLKGTYAIYNEAYRRAAEERGVLPREMQSITWEAIRGLFESEQKKGLKAPVEAIWQRYKKGEIEQDQAIAEVVELAGGYTPPAWAGSEYNETVSRTYEGPAAQDIDSKERVENPNPSVVFEVAPDPNNVELTAAWKALDAQTKLAISQDVAKKIVPEVLKELGTDGQFEMQIGGYKGDTNPSLVLKVDRPATLIATAKALGHALAQDSMMVTSREAVPGTEPVGVIEITLPDGWGQTEIEALYDKLWELEKDGKKLVGGFSASNGVMDIANFPDEDTKQVVVSTEELVYIIDKHLGGKFNVGGGIGHSAFIPKEEYGYDSDLVEGQEAEKGRNVRRVDSFRREATRLLEEALRGDDGVLYQSPGRDGAGSRVRLERGADAGLPRYGSPQEGASSVVGTHYSREQRSSLSGEYYGTGLKGAEYERVSQSSDPRLMKRVHFYVDTGLGVQPEQGVGAHLHGVTLDNLYDQESDPLGLYEASYDMGVDGNERANAFESSVLDAGFDGYFSASTQGHQGVAVLLGDAHTEVPVGVIDQDTLERGDVNQPERDPLLQKLVGRKLALIEAQNERGALELPDGVTMDDVRSWAPSGTVNPPTPAAEFIPTQTYRQDEEDKPNAAIDLKDETNLVIGLFESANLSSFLHEANHMFVREMELMIQEGLGDEQLREDYTTLVAFAGGKLDRNGMEKLARAFEAYLREGKAPIPELKPVFARFRAWLSAIYKSVQELVQPTEEVKAVFDRMIVAEQEIAEADAVEHLADWFEEMSEFSTEAEKKDYLRKKAKAQLSAEEARVQQYLNAYFRATGKKKEIQAQALAEIEAMPLYAVATELAKGAGMDIEALDEYVGEDARKQLPSPFKSKEGGVDPAEIATRHGFKSVEEMVSAMITEPSKKDALKARTDELVAEEEKMIREGLAKETPDGGYHTPERLAVLIAEANILERSANMRQQAKARGIKSKALREAARRQLAEMSVNDAKNYYKYTQAEQRAANAAVKALSEGDTQEAWRQKQLQVINHAMVLESLKVAKEVEKGERKIRKYLGSKSIEQDAKDLVVDIAIRFGFQKRPSRMTHAQWVQAYNDRLNQPDGKGGVYKKIEFEKFAAKFAEEGYSPAFAQIVTERTNARRFQEMRLEDFRAVIDTANQIAALDRGQRMVDAADGQITMDMARELLIGAMEKNLKPKDLDFWAEETFGEGVASVDSWLAKIEFLVETMDGGIEGPWHDLIWDQVTEAVEAENTRLGGGWVMENGKAVRTKGAADEINDIIEAHFSKTEIKHMSTKRTLVPAISKSLTRAQIIRVALDMGNESNFMRRRDGHGWTDEQMGAIKDQLTKKEWDFVQAVWDYIDSYREESFALEKRLTGHEPSRIMPQEVETKFGTYRGGYFPVVIARSRAPQNAVQKNRAAKEDALFAAGNYTSATTKHSHLKERAQTAGGMALSKEMTDITSHVYGVIHDLTHRRAILNAAKLVKDQQIYKSMVDHLGEPRADAFMHWLTDVANSNYDATGPWGKLFRSIRLGAVVFNLGKFAVMFQQVAGITQSIHRTRSLLPVGKLLKNAVMTFTTPHRLAASVREIQAKSKFMASRIKHYSREADDVFRGLKGKKKLPTRVGEVFMQGIGVLQFTIDLPTWQAAYDLKLKEGGSEAQAIAAGDKAVRMSQGGGSKADQARIQRGNEFLQLITMHYSFMNLAYNIFTKSYRGKNVDYADAMSAILLVGMLGPILAELASGRPPDEDDDEEWAEWMLKLQLRMGLGLIPGVRDVGNALTSGYGGFQLSPLEGPINTIVRGMKGLPGAIEDEDYFKAAKPFVDLAGLAYRFPSTQALITAEAFYRWLEDDPDFEPQDLIFRNRR